MQMENTRCVLYTIQRIGSGNKLGEAQIYCHELVKAGLGDGEICFHRFAVLFFHSHMLETQFVPNFRKGFSMD